MANTDNGVIYLINKTTTRAARIWSQDMNTRPMLSYSDDSETWTKPCPMKYTNLTEAVMELIKDNWTIINPVDMKCLAVEKPIETPEEALLLATCGKTVYFETRKVLIPAAELFNPRFYNKSWRAWKKEVYDKTRMNTPWKEDEDEREGKEVQTHKC